MELALELNNYFQKMVDNELNIYPELTTAIRCLERGCFPRRTGINWSNEGGRKGPPPIGGGYRFFMSILNLNLECWIEWSL